MSQEQSGWVRAATGAREARAVERIQSLWSGYGDLTRYALVGAERPSVVLKHVRPPTPGRGETLSHRRKLRSYRVETAWYRDYAARCGSGCPVPACLAVETAGDEVRILLEDLDASGYPRRAARPGWSVVQAGLRWLARFHATFLATDPSGLWPTGTYWHLETRPDELEALADRRLKRAARAIDRLLSGARYQSLVHGDAKLANFCFSDSLPVRVAAVDFQYVGGGCGMKDVAYFMGSCLGEAGSEQHEARALDLYFGELSGALLEGKPAVDPEAVEAEWRPLYRVAWADFHRFYEGWSPGARTGGYSRRVVRQVLDSLAASE